jgi:16S rRNA C967 or C1407 C5-methylase (RsmB/RsmF family)
MVNAVLRKLGAGDSPRPELPEENCCRNWRWQKAHPGWMVERWTDFYGLEAARAICRHGQTFEPGLTVRIAGSGSGGGT